VGSWPWTIAVLALASCTDAGVAPIGRRVMQSRCRRLRVLNGPGFVNLMWMFVGIWMGLFLARAMPSDTTAKSQRQAGAQQAE
jgi:hypothetical protein